MTEYVRGKVFGGMLVKALNLPPNTRSFDLHCDLDGVVTVKCECIVGMDAATKTISILKEFQLVDK